MSSANDTTSCTFTSATQRVNFIVYYCFAPCYFVLGVFGHALSIRAFILKWRTEKAYVFQMFVAVSEGCLVVAHIAYIVVCIWWAGWTGDKAQWFVTCYRCMWFAAHVPVYLYHSLLIITLLFTACLALDRLRALWRPTAYKDLSQVSKASVVAICIIIGFASDAFQTADFDVQATGPTYAIRPSAFVKTRFSKGLALLRSVVHVSVLVTLCCANTGVAILYRKKFSTNSSNAVSPATRTERRNKSNLLITLTISQCTFMAVVVFSFLLFITLQNFDIRCFRDNMTLFATILEGVFQVGTTANFYVMLVLSKEFRKMILDSLRIYRPACLGVCVQ